MINAACDKGGTDTMRVLLVEDDSATAKSVSMMLESEGIVCDTADLGEDGLEIGKIYDAVVAKVTNFGAFCEYMPGKHTFHILKDRCPGRRH